jgi:hypothetical protein
VGIAAHIARLRAVIGHELLLLPSVSVLPVDEAGRVLLVRHAGYDDGWGVLESAHVRANLCQVVPGIHLFMAGLLPRPACGGCHEPGHAVD